MTTRQALIGVVWIAVWLVVMALRVQTAWNPVPNPYLSSSDLLILDR